MKPVRTASLLLLGLVALLLATSIGFKTNGWARACAERIRWERDIGSLDFDAYAAPSLSDRDGALAALLAAAATSPPPSVAARNAARQFVEAPTQPVEPAATAALREAMAASEAGLELERAVAERPGTDPREQPSDSVAGSGAQSQRLRRLSSRTGLDLALAVIDRDEARALRALALDARIVEALHAEPTLFSLAVAAASEKQFLLRVRAFLATAPTFASAASLSSEAERAARSADFERSLASEAAFVSTALRRPNSRFAPSGVIQQLAQVVLPISMYDSEAGTLAALRETLALREIPYVEWRKRYPDPEVTEEPPARGSLFAIVRRLHQHQSRIRLRDDQVLRDARRLALRALAEYPRLEESGAPGPPLTEGGDVRSVLSGGGLRWSRQVNGPWELSFEGAREALEPLRGKGCLGSSDRDLALLSWPVPAASRMDN